MRHPSSNDTIILQGHRGGHLPKSSPNPPQKPPPCAGVHLYSSRVLLRFLFDFQSPLPFILIVRCFCPPTTPVVDFLVKLHGQRQGQGQGQAQRKKDLSRLLLNTETLNSLRCWAEWVGSHHAYWTTNGIIQLCCSVVLVWTFVVLSIRIKCECLLGRITPLLPTSAIRWLQSKDYVNCQFSRRRRRRRRKRWRTVSKRVKWSVFVFDVPILLDPCRRCRRPGSFSPPQT